MNDNGLSLLGLALRGGRLAVGDDAVSDAAFRKDARLILTASDASEHVRRSAEHLARQGDCLAGTLPCTKAELGGALGRGSAAVCALTDIGLAASLAKRLAAEDPERWTEAAERLSLKAKRAKERRSTRADRLRDPARKRDAVKGKQLTGKKREDRPPRGVPPRNIPRGASEPRRDRPAGNRFRDASAPSRAERDARPLPGRARDHTQDRRGPFREKPRGAKPFGRNADRRPAKPTARNQNRGPALHARGHPGKRPAGNGSPRRKSARD